MREVPPRRLVRNVRQESDRPPPFIVLAVNDPLRHVAQLRGVGQAVQDSRAAVDNLLGHQVLRSRSAEVSAESSLRGARASAALEGRDLPLAAVRAGAKDSPLARGAVRASGELGTFVDTWRRAPRQVLARLHVLVAAGSVPTDELGRPRSERRAEELLGLGDPPSADEVTARLDALADLLVAGTHAPAIVTAAIIHGELLALRPFGFGDGLVARAAERLALVAGGLDPKSLAVPEVGHWELREEYGAAIRNYTRGGAENVSMWVRHCAQAVSLGARESTAICEALLRTRS